METWYKRRENDIFMFYLRFINDPLNVEPSNGPRVFGGLSLCVIEVGRYCDDGRRDVVTEVGLRSLLHLLEDHGRDLLRGELTGAALNVHL